MAERVSRLAPADAQALFWRPPLRTAEIVQNDQLAELGMPPLIVWALGAVGAFVVAKWVAREAKRVSAAVHANERAAMGRGKEEVRPLEQDPVTGIYRPK
jgi:hypothetical protein